jgi:hypothetical protein
MNNKTIKKRINLKKNKKNLHLCYKTGMLYFLFIDGEAQSRLFIWLRLFCWQVEEPEFESREWDSKVHIFTSLSRATSFSSHLVWCVRCFFVWFLLLLLLGFFLVGLGFNSGLHTCKSRHSTVWTTLPIHFSLVILEMGSHKLFAQAGLKLICQISASQIARITGTPATFIFFPDSCNNFSLFVWIEKVHPLHCNQNTQCSFWFPNINLTISLCISV